MKIRRSVFVLTAALCSGAALRAAPSVSAVEGALSEGAVLTAKGSSFGVHGDFHPASDKLIRVFDDFNDGSLAANPYETWSAYNGSANPSPVDYSRQSPRTSRPGEGFYRRTHVGLGYLAIPAEDRPEYFSSFYMRLSDGFDIASAGSGTHQFKIIRLYSTNSTSEGKINIYPAIGHDDGFHYMFEFIKPLVTRGMAQLNAIPDRPYGWNKMAVYYKKSSSLNANDGRCRVWWNNKLVFDWKPHFEDPANGRGVITGDFDSDDGNLAGDWAVGNYFSSASPSTWVDFDDVYLNHTQARVELGNAPTYGACSILEIQPPSSWSDARVGVKANLGALPPGGPVYLYVTDKEGNVNSAGFRVPADGAGSVGAENPGTVAGNSAPAVEVHAPADGVEAAPDQRTLDLTGTAADEDGVARVSWSNDRGDAGDASGTGQWAAGGIPLHDGENRIRITAVDGAGNAGTVEIRVVRRAAEAGESAADLKPGRKFLSFAGAAQILEFGRRAVEVHIFDALGNAVRRLERGSAGRAAWDGRDGAGRAVESGVYICRITGDSGRVAYHSLAVIR
ncbi:MAG: hypothetical protein ACT4O3_05205 [Elusimicrobiota bacterium]